MKEAIKTGAKETRDVVKNTPLGLIKSPVKLIGLPRRIGNAVATTGRELFGVFKDSAYTVKKILTGHAPETVGPVKRFGNIMKSQIKIPFGDVRKNIKDDFQYEKDKTKALRETAGEGLSAIGQLPKKTREVVKTKAEDIASLFVGSGKPAAAA